MEQSAGIFAPADRPSGSLPANSPCMLPAGGVAAFQIPACSGSPERTSCCSSAAWNASSAAGAVASAAPQVSSPRRPATPRKAARHCEPMEHSAVAAPALANRRQPFKKPTGSFRLGLSRCRGLTAARSESPMLTLTQNILILIAAMTLSLLFMLVTNHFWPAKERYAREDLIGWQLNILGSTYAVILGIMFFTVWTDFRGANMNADLEASALRNVYRIAQGLPPEQRLRLQTQTRAY